MSAAAGDVVDAVLGNVAAGVGVTAAAVLALDLAFLALRPVARLLTRRR